MPLRRLCGLLTLHMDENSLCIFWLYNLGKALDLKQHLRFQ